MMTLVARKRLTQHNNGDSEYKKNGNYFSNRSSNNNLDQSLF